MILRALSRAHAPTLPNQNDAIAEVCALLSTLLILYELKLHYLRFVSAPTRGQLIEVSLHNLMAIGKDKNFFAIIRSLFSSPLTMSEMGAVIKWVGN